MLKKFLFLISFILLICFVSNVQAKPFSLIPIYDTYVSNDNYEGPNSNSENATGMHIRDQGSSYRCNVGFAVYDLRQLSPLDCNFSNISISNYGHDRGTVHIYGVLESQEHLVDEGITWNTAPGVMNSPTPALNSPVELDMADITDILLTFTAPARGERESTDVSQELADFLNSDTNGIVVLMFAPDVGSPAILRTIDSGPDYGSFLEGEFSEPIQYASNPNPPDGTQEVARDVVLSWTPGKYADKHNLYLGTNLDNVSNADTSSLLLVGPAQDANSFNAGRLDFGQIYYWRIDEVNTPPDNTVFKGNVWSFTIESLAYPIPGERITATAFSQSEGKGPENTINLSGLNTDNLHSKASENMWLSAEGTSEPVWIQYEFDKIHKLHEMHVWNYNGENILSSYGFKQISVEYSINGEDWMHIDSISEFAKAPGTDNYAYNTTIPFDGLPVKYVKITAISNWSNGLFNQYGLSEVRFMSIPVFAKSPTPESGETDVEVDTTFSWQAGREAYEHNVYISTDEQAVIDGTVTAVTIGQTSYSPSLDMDSTYFWRVDEVNNAETWTTWQGDIWNFSTQKYLIVDDFESYNDIAADQEGSKLVYNTWVDGYDNPSTNGSTIGYVKGSSLETTVVHDGGQSVPLFYDNTTASISEVTVDPAKLSIGRNWSIGSPKVLVLWIHGDVGNTGNDQLYVKIGNSIFQYNGEISRPRWEPMIVDLTGVNINNVTSLTIGIERTGGTGGSGILFVDDILLYGLAPQIPSEIIWIEAEDYDSIEAPMKIYDDPNASGGKYLAVETGNDSSSAPPASGGVARYTFEVQGGTYLISGRVISTWYYDDSFYVRIQDATIQTPTVGWVNWNYIAEGSDWHWDVVMDSLNNYVDVEWTLTAGTHILEIAYREDGALLDAIVIEKVD